MSRRAILSLGLAASLAGCFGLFAGEGDETLSLTNENNEPIVVSLIIEQEVGGIRVFQENVPLAPRETKDAAVAMKPGIHFARLTTSTGVQETLGFEIPSKGDTAIKIVVRRGGASVSTTTTA